MDAGPRCSEIRSGPRKRRACRRSAACWVGSARCWTRFWRPLWCLFWRPSAVQGPVAQASAWAPAAKAGSLAWRLAWFSGAWPDFANFVNLANFANFADHGIGSRGPSSREASVRSRLWAASSVPGSAFGLGSRRLGLRLHRSDPREPTPRLWVPRFRRFSQFWALSPSRRSSRSPKAPQRREKARNKAVVDRAAVSTKLCRVARPAWREPRDRAHLASACLRPRPQGRPLRLPSQAAPARPWEAFQSRCRPPHRLEAAPQDRGVEARDAGATPSKAQTFGGAPQDWPKARTPRRREAPQGCKHRFAASAGCEDRATRVANKPSWPNPLDCGPKVVRDPGPSSSQSQTA